ncbi:MAG: M67 family metallopeptidase [Nitrospirae bacterium]|nr:M67 family metallopeptidase [Nitrospirota bacterium]
MSDLVIPREFIEQIVAHCRACYPDEACGILAGTGNRVTKVYAMKNAEPSPISYFMDTGEQFRVMKELRQEGLTMVAIFHSHPQSPAYPSATDIRLAFYDDLFYVIAGMLNGTLSELRAFTIFGGEVREVKINVNG